MLETHLLASQAAHLISELALEALHDKAVVPHLVDLPFPLAHDLRRQRLQVVLAFRRHLDRRRLVHDVVAVLVQAVQEKAEELLRVVLLRAAELGRDAADRLSERDGREEVVLLGPQHPNELGDRVRQRAFGAERIDDVDVLAVSAPWIDVTKC